MAWIGLPCVAFGAAGVACNALSGIGDFTVASDAGVSSPADVGQSEGAAGGDGGLPEGAADAAGSADSGMGDADAASPGDGASDAMVAPSDAVADAPGDAAEPVDAPSDAGGSDASTVCAAAGLTCDAGCTMHSNGVGQSFYDCAPLGTYDLTQAFSACAAFSGDAGACGNDPIACSSGDQVCSSGSSVCVCWRYNGTNAGKVHNAGSSTCTCIGSTNPTWN